MAKIIISYRRADSQAMAGRLFDRLSARYGEHAVFMDIDAIPFGIDFRRHIGDALGQCDVLIALVGPHWLGQRDGGGSRIDDPADPVRVEIEGAFERGIPVIPVLIDNARMPGEAELPPSLKQFSFLNAAPVDSGRDFRPHVDRLMRSLDGIVAGKGAAGTATSSATDASKPRSRKSWYAIAGLVLVVGVGALLVIPRMQQPSLDPQGGIATSSPVIGSVPEAPPQPTGQQAVVLKSADEYFVRGYANDIKSANVNLAVTLDSAAAASGISEQWDAMVKGELDLASFHLQSVSDKVPAFAATTMPGLVRNREHAGRVDRSAFMAQIKRMAAAAGVIVLADAWQSIAVLSKKGCIRRPGDAKGLKISTYAVGDGFTPVLQAAGATSVDLVEGDVSAALKSDSGAVVAPLASARGVAELAGCVTIPGEYTLGFGYSPPLLASKKTFGRLNINQQNAVLNAAKASERAWADGYKQIDDYLISMLGTSGVQTVTLSEADYEAWVRVAQTTTYKEFAATVPGGKELIEEALAVK